MNRKHAFTLGIVFASVVSFAWASAQAQPGGFGPRGKMNPEDRISWRAGYLSEKLDLSEEQTESIRDILEKAHGEAAAWREAHPEASREDWQVFHQEHRATIDTAILDVLSEDQQAIYRELQDEQGPHGAGMRDTGKGIRHHMGMGPGMAHGMGHGMDRPMGQGMHGDRCRKRMRRMAMKTGERDWLAGPLMRGLALKLELTELQRGRLAAIRGGQRDAMNEWNTSHPDATWQDRLAFRRDQFDASIAAIGDLLTEEQNEKLNELSAERASRGFERHGWGRNHKMFMRRLDLTKEQEEQLTNLRDQHRAAARAWHDANPNATGDERQAFREGHRKGMEASLEKILTNDQMAKLKSLRARHHRGPGCGPSWDKPDDPGDDSGRN